MTIAQFGLRPVMAAMPVPQDGSAPVEQEPRHVTVLTNEYVQALRVTLQAGDSAGMHTRSHDDAAVRYV